MPVDVSSQLLTTGGALIEITDRGIGMGPKEMAYANWQLENVPSADGNVPKWMGLFVVARLAARHGIRVRLHPAQFGGLTALVWLPDEILTQPGAVASPRLGDSRTAGPAPGMAGSMTGTAFDPRNGTAAPLSALGPTRTDIPVPVPATQAAGTLADRTAGASPPPAPGSLEPGGIEDPAPFGPPLGVAARASQETDSGQRDVVVPPAEGRADQRGLPIFDEVESRWFGAGRVIPGRTAADPRWSSPADEGWRAAQSADVPASAGPTAVGLPRRRPAANLIPGAIPSTEPFAPPARSAAEARDRLAGFQRGISEGRAVAGEPADEAEAAGPET
jgi:hypothetical protein